MAASAEFGTPSRSASGPVSPQPRVRSRTQSISSDRPSTVGYGMMSPPLSVSPSAAFIAAAAASQIVTNDHDNHANTWYDQHGIEPSGETALVSHAALQLVNSFLDQLLFRFLSLARSTSLHALRPAVTETLKPKLAKDAINQADEELREYLGGGDDEDMLQSQTPDSPKDWDLELVWKRTRLRCMVYSSLGDMEEEDEDFYMDQEQLGSSLEDLNETVSPAVAIFLTSILEFMGEQTLISAGQAAFHRMRFLHDKERSRATTPPSISVANRVTVEEVDMERVAFDRTLGRLWRAWKKRVRSPVDNGGPVLQRSISGDLNGVSSRPTSSHQRRTSQDESTIAEVLSESNALADHADKSIADEEAANELQERTGLEKQPDAQDTTPNIVEERRASVDWLSIAAATPLPESENDVLEILIPDIGYFSDEDDKQTTGKSKSRRNKTDEYERSRPKSLMIFSHGSVARLPTPTVSEPRTPDAPFSRKRANSLPTPSVSPYSTPKVKRVKPFKEDGEREEQQSTVEGANSSPENDQGNEPTAVPIVSAPSTEPTKPLESSEPAEPANATKKGTETSVAAPVPTRPNTRQRRSPPVSLQTRVIGAAITTPTPRAVPLSSIKTNVPLGEDDIDEFTEEPEILTSSRVSISGRSGSRSNSPTVSEITRSGSVGSTRPARSPSVHSLRLIEVAVPRSPVTRSQRSSFDIHDVNRANNVSRASTISTQAIAEEVVQPSSDVTSSPTGRSSSTMAAKTSRPCTSESISEAEHEHEVATPRKATSAPQADGTPSANPETTTRSAPAAEIQTALPALNAGNTATGQRTPSASSLAPSSVHPPSPLSTGPAASVAVLGTPTSTGTFFLDEKPEVPPKPSPAELPLPARSPRRPGSSGLGVPTAAVGGAVAVGGAAALAALKATREKEQQEQEQAEANVEAQAPVDAQTQSQAKAQALALAQLETQERSEAEGTFLQHSNTSESSAASTTSSSKLRPIRTSEESMVMRPEDVARNFEQLIQSDETIQYTLTPENMRSIDPARATTDSSSIVVRSRKSDDGRSRSSSVNRAASESRATAQETPAPAVPPVTTKPSGPVPRPSRNSIVPSSASIMSSRSRKGGPQARDARVPRESLADLAEFIRSTGPLSSKMTGTPVSRNGSTINGSTTSGLRSASGPTTLSQSRSKSSLDSGGVSSFSSPHRPKFQPREPTVNYKDDNSDLIDFIRRGPPNATGSPRIPRTIAPFRTTMDSDQMSGAVGGRAVDANIASVRYSAASTSVTESSMGSATGLLKKDKRLAQKMGAPTPGSGKGNYTTFGGRDGPVRKSRPAKDPYAIDVSDEEELGGGAPVASGGRQPATAAREESLLDFLSSVPPPAEPTPVLFDIPQTRQLQQQLQQQQQQVAPKKKASTSSLMSRFRRDVSNSMSAPRLSRSNTATNVATVSGSTVGGLDARPISSRTASILSGRGKNHTPIQVNMPPPTSLDRYTTASGGSVTAGSRPTTGMTTGTSRVSMRKYEPREAQPMPSRSTRDLAEFFRSSGPPQTTQS